MKFNLKKRISITNGPGKGYTSYEQGEVFVDDANTSHIDVLRQVAEAQEDVSDIDVDESRHWLNLNYTIDSLVDTCGIESVSQLAALTRNELVEKGFSNAQIKKLAKHLGSEHVLRFVE